MLFVAAMKRQPPQKKGGKWQSQVAPVILVWVIALPGRFHFSLGPKPAAGSAGSCAPESVVQARMGMGGLERSRIKRGLHGERGGLGGVGWGGVQ